MDGARRRWFMLHLLRDLSYLGSTSTLQIYSPAEKCNLEKSKHNAKTKYSKGGKAGGDGSGWTSTRRVTGSMRKGVSGYNRQPSGRKRQL
eukprot:2264903-Pleurochrysis_carterae.AAC.2